MNTPITDAAAGLLVGSPFSDGDHPLVDTARQLERDRARLLESLKIAQRVFQGLSFSDAPINAARKAAADALASLEIKDKP